MRGDGPDVPERILESPGAITIELVGQRSDFFGAGLERAIEDIVHILDIEQDADARSAERLRTVMTHLGRLIGQHDDGITDFDLGMPDFAAGPFHAEELSGVKRPLVEVDGLSSVLDDEVRSYRA